MSLQTAIDRVQGIIEGLSGMRQAPAQPPEQASAFPFGVAFAGTGSYVSGNLGKILTDGLHQIRAEIHVARRDLPRDIEAAVPYAQRLRDALEDDPTLSGAAVGGVRQLDYEFSAMAWGKVETIGYRFNITVMTDEC